MNPLAVRHDVRSLVSTDLAELHDVPPHHGGPARGNASDRPAGVGVDRLQGWRGPPKSGMMHVTVEDQTEETSMSTVLRSLAFQGNAREAMEFYQSVFGGELGISTFTPSSTPCRPRPRRGQGHARPARLGRPHPHGLQPPARHTAHTPGDTVSLVLWGDDEQKLRGWYEALSEGGEVNMSLERQIWGDLYGDLRDRFGILWSVNISTPGEARGPLRVPSPHSVAERRRRRG